VTVDLLVAKGLVKSAGARVKVLGDGELQKKLVVQAHAFSASAKEKIEKAGGAAEVISH
jgi:large subunit ribosomal protein L15